jgi:hypothetical protein
MGSWTASLLWVCEDGDNSDGSNEGGNLRLIKNHVQDGKV